MTKPMKPVTGVARGSEGTAANLEDTQEYDVSTFVAPAVGVDDDPVDDPLEDPGHDSATADAPAREPARPPAPSRRVRDDRRRAGSIPLAVKAALLTAVIALAVVFGASIAGQPGDPSSGLGAGTSVTTTSAPTDPPEDEGDGGGKDKGNGCGNGRGNGNNC